LHEATAAIWRARACFFASPQALTHVLLVIILDELAAASAGDQGPIVAAVREAVQRLVKQVFAVFRKALQSL
jgi:hypothetical protein